MSAGTAIGVGVVVAILLVLPLGAVWWARRWRDPPPEEWGLSLTGQPDLGAVEFRVRKQYGLRDEKTWEQVRRAAIRGEAAPDGLRAPAADYAQARVEALESLLRGRAGRSAAVTTAVTVVVVAGAVTYSVLADNSVGILYGLYAIGLAAFYNPYLVRRRADRARRAVEVNRS